MKSITQQLYEENLVTPPKWLPNTIQFESYMGSKAYSCDSPSSDFDIYGFCIPDKEILFPHLIGEVPGFGTPKERFNQFESHHIMREDREYDLNIYSLPKYLHLCMENNPNMIDSLFTSDEVVTYISPIGKMVRDKRHIFLSKSCYYKIISYADSQLKAFYLGKGKENPERKASIEKYGIDVKFLYHMVRLLLSAEQILQTHDLILEKHSSIFKEIRSGLWSKEKGLDYFNAKRATLDSLYENSKLQEKAPEEEIRQLLYDCLEQQYGSLKGIITV